MRNDAAKWSPTLPPGRSDVQIKRVRISEVRFDRLTLISGPVSAALALAGMPKATGWPDAPPDGPHALRLRRDRILVVNGPDLANGWHADQGLAVSDMTGGYFSVDITGEDAFSLLQMGTEISLEEQSGSVARALFALPCLVHATVQKQSFRVSVQSAYRETLWELLTRSTLTIE